MYIIELLVDINECNHGHRPDVGHYCPSDAECINTDGGFKCKCPVNHTFIDRGGHTSMCQGMKCLYYKLLLIYCSFELLIQFLLFG